MTTHLILGTAGHIDHGKTSLIKALTGTDTDRLPEEKKRGITIELGFAELDLGEFRLGIVDVPGHEKFVRQMLAGATSVDLAILVVAADDSVKQQTREHFEVLKLLELPAGVIALTKCDVSDEEWIDLVEEEVRELVRDSFLAGAPIIRTSAATGAGLEDLKSSLTVAAEAAAAARGVHRIEAPFRMAIDRAFTIAGHGTVVTGSIASGTLQVGDQLFLEPGRVEVRVRGLQNHDRKTESAHAGQRAAINLAGVRHDEVRRGQELASDGFLTPSQLMTACVEMLPTVPRALKNRMRVRVHLGTAETLASVTLLGGKELGPGQSGLAQLYLAEPIVSSWNQAFVLRSESPVVTIGGGHVLVPAAEKMKHASDTAIRHLGELELPDEKTRAAAAIYFAGTQPWSMADLARLAGIDAPERVTNELLDDGELTRLVLSPQREAIWHRDVMEEMCQRIERTLGKMHDHEPLRSSVQRSKLRHQLAYCLDGAMLAWLLASMEKAKRVRLTEQGVGLAGRGPQLSKSERQLLASLIVKFRNAGFQPPTIKECEDTASKNKASVASLVALAAADGDLVQVSSEFYLHRDVEQELRDKIASAIKEQGGLTLSAIRELMATSRKYAVPICEYLDRSGFTRREGDLRLLQPVADT